MTVQGSVVFAELKRNGDIARSLELPCGQCVGCRLERSRQWAMRCMHEASLYDLNCFVTLTYSDEEVPVRGQLVYKDFQRFMRSLRKRTGMKIRFFMCGEYGELNARPHFHALLFGYDFLDKVKFKRQEHGQWLYRSPFLESVWTRGMSLIGALTFESAAYVARYCMKKVTGPGATEHYLRRDEFGTFSLQPEFARMSLKPGIGQPWLQKFAADVFPRDFVVVNGKEVKPPKYYDRLFSESGLYDMDWIKYERMLEAEAHGDDNTPERLAVREKVVKAKLNQFKRGN